MSKNVSLRFDSVFSPKGLKTNFSATIRMQYFYTNRMILLDSDWILFNYGLDSPGLWNTVSHMMEPKLIKSRLIAPDQSSASVLDKITFDKALINQFIYEGTNVYMIPLAKLVDPNHVSNSLLRLSKYLFDELRMINIEKDVYKAISIQMAV